MIWAYTNFGLPTWDGLNAMNRVSTILPFIRITVTYTIQFLILNRFCHLYWTDSDLNDFSWITYTPDIIPFGK